MQDIHSIGGGRLFGSSGGGVGGGDRRLRQHPHQNHQAIKCPRCDSLNTKFCYYNNYNLSQPRHFCKNCRRYWTKGGVLRNVPVGGGCRKAKRNSKPKPNSESSSANTQTQTPAEQREQKMISHSSSESSSTLTVTTNNNPNVEAVTSVHSSSSVLSSVNDNQRKFLGQASDNDGNNNNNSNNNNNYNHDPGSDQPATTGFLEQGSSDCGIFSEIESFTNLITSSNENLSYGFCNLLNNNDHQNPDHFQNEQWQQQQLQQQQREDHKMVSGNSINGYHHQDLKMQDLTSGLLDQTVQFELSSLEDRSGNNGGFGSLDWQGSGGGDDDQGLFDLPHAVDHVSYWSQSTEWTDQDHARLYIP